MVDKVSEVVVFLLPGIKIFFGECGFLTMYCNGCYEFVEAVVIVCVSHKSISSFEFMM